MVHLLIFLFYLFHYGRTQLRVAGTVPLLVRSPYLNCWSSDIYDETSTNATVAAACDDSYWHLGDTLYFNLCILVRVDNITYSAMGYERPAPRLPLLTNTVVSPTQTKFIMKAGSMQVNLTFLNPIEPGDWVKQSIPFSYLSLTAKSLDGAAHAVQVYSDLSSTWNPGVSWTFKSGTYAAHYAIRLGSSNVYNESSEMALYLGMGSENGANVTYKISEERVSHDLFQSSGMLDEGPEGPMDDSFSNSTGTPAAFALSRDLGTIQATQGPIVWVFGYTADPVITYTDLSGTPQQRSSYYRIRYQDHFGDSLIVDFVNDFADASSRAQQLDQKILQSAAPISGLLGDLVSFATAQVYGSTQLTIGTDANGQFNKSDVMAFMKNKAGLSGLSDQPYRVNAVETLYSAFPAFMCIDPKLGGLLLEPLFRLQASPKYTIPYAAPDLGMVYPNVTISNSAHNQSVEESGNMLIMTYAHARASGNDSLIIRYYPLLTAWADYLSNATLLIHDQASADGLRTNNQTNLAIKGIIAIEAMSKMGSIVSKAPDVDKYSSTAANLYAQWKSLALTDDRHLLAAYGRVDSWTLGYNLFADVWLDTNVVDSSVYHGQGSFLNNLFTSNFSNSTSNSPIGMPTDNIGFDVGNGWEMFVAAMTPNQALSTNLISSVYTQGQRFEDVKTLYSPYLVEGPSPAAGAMYAPLALLAPVRLVVNPTQTGTPQAKTPPKSHRGVVTGGVIGGVVALLAVGTIALVAWHRRRQSHRHGRTPGSSFLGETTNQGTQVTVTPFNPTMLTPTEAAPLAAGTQMDFHQRLFSRPFPPGDSSLSLRRMVSVPVGLSGKELARLRSNRSRSQPMVGRASYPPLTVTIGRDALGGAASSPTSSSEARRPRSENNISRHEIDEIQQLPMERSDSPPSYVSRLQGSDILGLS